MCKWEEWQDILSSYTVNMTCPAHHIYLSWAVMHCDNTLFLRVLSLLKHIIQQKAASTFSNHKIEAQC